MFKYCTEQKSYKIGNYMVGGDPRSVPTALAGTIFYLQQKKIFKDEKKGQIDKSYAEALIKKQEELADKTGLTPLLDVVLSYEGSIRPLLDFVFEVSDTPILVDAPYWEIKKPMIKYLIETGLDRQVVYNTITSSSFDEEFELLRQTEIENFILLPIESRFWTTKARMDITDNLIRKALSYNFKKHNLMIDTCAIDYTSLGIAMSTIEEVKNKYGYPAGTAGQNIADAWKNLIPKFGDIKKYVKIVACTITLAAGADFIFYGPIQLADLIYPNAAFVKAAHSQLLFDEGRMAPPDHPIFKIG